MADAHSLRSAESRRYPAVLMAVVTGLALAACQRSAPETSGAGVTVDTAGILASIDNLAGRVILHEHPTIRSPK